MNLKLKNTLLIGMAFFAIQMFWKAYYFIIPLFLDKYGLDDTIIGIIMAIDNIGALLLLPLVGMFSDKTHTKIGRRMPYIIIGTLLASVLMMLMPIAQGIRSLPLLITAMVLTVIAMCMYRSPAVSLMPDITPKPLRSKGNAIINLMGAVGTIMAMGLTMILFMEKDGKMVLSENAANYLTFGIVALFMLISLILMVIFVKEPKLVKEKEEQVKEYNKNNPDNVIEDEKLAAVNQKEAALGKDKLISLLLILFAVSFWFMGYNAVETFFSKYAAGSNNVLGMTVSSASLPVILGSVGAMLAFYPASVLAGKIGRRKTIIIGIIVIALAFGLCYFVTSTTTALLFIVFPFAGIGWATINVNSYPMVVEMASAGKTGKFTGLYYSFSMGAQVITSILAGVAITIFGMKALFIYAAVFLVLSLICMIFVRHGDAAKIKEKPAESQSQTKNLENSQS